MARQRRPSLQTSWIEPAQAITHKLKRSTPRDKLDAAIDWYEKYKPTMPHVMPGGVYMTVAELNKFATKQDDKTWSYRTWTLTQAEPPAKASERMEIAK